MYAEILRQLHDRFTPHPGQIAPGLALFRDGVRRIFLRFGRQTGKSYLMAYLAVRWALTHPGASIFIITPFLNQTRELYLHSGLIERMIPLEYLDGEPHKTDGRFRFKNGAQIKLLGADNAESIRGLTADLVLIDEIKDVPDNVFRAIIMPTLHVRRAPLVIAGTPPELPEHPYWGHVKIAETDPAWRIFHQTSYDNPYIAKEDIDREREIAEARGELDVFKREYLAEYCPGEKRMIFPMLDDALHVRPYDALKSEIYQRADAWSWYVAMDPGTASTFAVILGAVNHYRGQVRVLDEVYVTRQSEISIGKVWPEVQKRMRELWVAEGDDSDWMVVCDEAATWARVELLDRYAQQVWPTDKAKNKKPDGLSLIKDLLITKDLVISDRCQNLLREMKGYALGDNGLPVKRNDHAIDTLRYLLGIANFSVRTSPLPEQQKPLTAGQLDDPRRAYRPEDDLALVGTSGIDLWDDGQGYLFDSDDY